MMMGTSIGHGTLLEKTKISAKENIGLCESKSYNPWFDDKCLKLVDQKKQAKLQRLQDPSEVNEVNLHTVSRKASRHFKNKKREYLKEKINEIELNRQIRTSETCIGA
jgi:hypothetical protein